eukprot:gene30859-37291_t
MGNLVRLVTCLCLVLPLAVVGWIRFDPRKLLLPSRNILPKPDLSTIDISKNSLSCPAAIPTVFKQRHTMIWLTSNGEATSSNETVILPRKRFLPEDDEKLLSAIRECQVAGVKVSWGAVADKLASKSKSQCLRRWRYLAKTQASSVCDILADKETLFGNSTPHWSREEDEKLLSGIREFQIAKQPVSWDVVLGKVGTRSEEQCTRRWRFLARSQSNNTFDTDSAVGIFYPGRNRRWSKEEDEKLLTSIRDFQQAKQTVLWNSTSEKVADIIVDSAILFPNFSWSEGEDEKLLSAIRGFQQSRRQVSWEEVAASVESRSPVQCRR